MDGLSGFSNWKEVYLTTDDPEKRKQGFQLLFRAVREGDPEASFLLAELLLEGVVHLKNGSSKERAFELLQSAANAGFLPARRKLNGLCEQVFQKEDTALVPKQDASPSPLKDFNGNIIKINRKGALTPVDARLSFENGKNTLTLSLNLVFCFTGEIADERRFMQAVIAGIREWEGEYLVFGNQKLELQLKITIDEKLFDSVLIIPVTDDIAEWMKDVADLTPGKRGEVVNNIIKDKRSFATIGMKKWSVYSRKNIMIQSMSDSFDDYEEIQAVAKHEFGHVLGLGDLYASVSDSLPGVEKGTYPELDEYYITEKIYNLVMCDHHGPISNNDIEMVVLAFMENKMQLYQVGQSKGKISKALGRGN